MVWLVIAALVVATSAVAALRSDTTTPAPALQGDLDAMVAAGTPGAVLLVRDGNQVTHLTAGVAEIATKRAMTAGDSYRIASLTKTYVATVVLQLAGEGKLRLTDTVERWLPGLVPKGNKITVHQLLNHTSGLYDHERDPQVLKPYLSGNLGYYWSPLRLVKLAVTRKARFAPGASKISSYSSTNYLVLGLIVERVTGNPLGVELKRRIFQLYRLSVTVFVCVTLKTDLLTSDLVTVMHCSHFLYPLYALYCSDFHASNSKSNMGHNGLLLGLNDSRL